MFCKNKKLYSFFWNIIKPYKWYAILMLQAPIVNASYGIMYNYAIKLLIDLLSTDQLITLKVAYIPILYFVLAQVILDSSWRIHNFGQLKMMPYVGRDLLIKTEEYLFKHSYKFFQNNFSGSLISKAKDINNVFFKIWNDITGHTSCLLFKTIATGLFLALKNFKIFSVILAFCLVSFPLFYIFLSGLGKRSFNCVENWHKIVGKTGDKIANIFAIFSFARRKKEIQNSIDIYKNENIPIVKKFFIWDFWWCLILSFVYWAFLIGLFILIIDLKNKNEISLGDVAYVMSLSYLFSDSLWHTLFSFQDLVRYFADLRSAFSIIEEPHEEIDVKNAKDIKITKGEIEIKDLCFGYSKEKQILNNINLKIKAGEKIGLVGYSGSGKSTLISVLLKYFKISSGDILIDNQSIFNADSDSVRAQISLIPQDPAVFYRSIGENIGYGKENSTEDHIEKAARLAKIHDIIMQMPEKYNTLIGEKGAKLSGGQKQRVAIARALLKNAPILILDEATSALDSKTEQEIQNSINQILDSTKATVIAIAHRLSTVKHLDRIIVMQEGRIVEDGSFIELINKKDGKFKELWEHQTSGIL